MQKWKFSASVHDNISQMVSYTAMFTIRPSHR